MEIQRNTSQILYLDLIGATADVTPTATLIKSDATEEILAVSPSTEPAGVTERWETYIGLENTQNDQHLDVVWEFLASGEVAVKTDHLHVVTPYVTLDEIRDELPELDALSDKAALALERRVRYIIDTYVGTSFGRHEGTKTVRGNGEGKLLLPNPLISFTGVNSNGVALDPTFLKSTPSGLYLGGVPYYPDGEITTVGPIFNPYTYNRTWKSEVDYVITGIWGWEHVPGEVSMAAKILMSDYGCRDSTYRDRYVSKVGTSDWNMSLSGRAFSGTGNVQADQLLDAFKSNSMVVI